MDTRIAGQTAASPGVKGRSRRRRARTRVRGQEGQSLVEFALVLPILFMVVLGVVAFGIALNNYLSLTNATNLSTRQLSISRGQTADPCNLAATTFYAAAPNLTQTSLTFTITLNSISVGGTTCTAGTADMVAGAPATVKVTYPCNLTVFGVNFAPSGCTLTSQVSEDVQ